MKKDLKLFVILALVVIVLTIAFVAILNKDDFINKDNRLTDEQKMGAIKYYNAFYNNMISDFNASFENERDAESKLTFVNEKYMGVSF